MAILGLSACGGKSTAGGGGSDFDDQVQEAERTPPCGRLGGACCGLSCEQPTAAGCDCVDRGTRCRNGTCCGAIGAACSVTSECCSGYSCAGTCCVPSGGVCIGSNDCCAGQGLLCQDGTCTSAPPNQGGAGQSCVATSTGTGCLAGFACDSGTNTCQPCGRTGEPCCDGEDPCRLDRTCDTATNTCSDRPNCGGEGAACCTPQASGDDGCAVGLDCSGDNVCVRANVPGAAGSTCGGLGQDCCEGFACGSGLICSPLLITDPKCIEFSTVRELVSGITDAFCGEEGQICCPLRFTCGCKTRDSDADCDETEQLHCDFLRCVQSTECNRAGETCTSGDQCCQGPPPGLEGVPSVTSGTTICALSPSVQTCCRGAGAICSGNDAECCGRMQCVNGSCKARGREETCLGGLTVQECVPGTECSGQPGSRRCESVCSLQAGAECSSTFGCCVRPLQCLESTDGMGSKTTRCCGSGGASCQGQAECCGESKCESNRCEVAGVCDQLGTLCDPGSDLCCGGAAECLRDETGSTDRCCLFTAGATCRTKSDCCGKMPCQNGQCVELELGQECVLASDCKSLSCARDEQDTLRCSK